MSKMESRDRTQVLLQLGRVSKEITIPTLVIQLPKGARRTILSEIWLRWKTNR
jgi:hypothetical protein